MNSFGRIFRVQIFGESHGDGVGVVIDGCPAGLDIPVEDFLPDMERRKGGRKKELRPGKKMIFLFSGAVILMERRRAFLL
ncbi:chorismate synthase [Niabella hibiscisoli]|uniref:chorismate synthase n=1 Tax=Niabella hibiscisoli TaxID=1825928 RepID=UPI0021D4321B|nr:chorismate synthase [Niabella hibiscisoli]